MAYMRNLKLTIEYDGSCYSGWQVQNRLKGTSIRTIQGELERALKVILHEFCKVTGVGRTDAGVHARSYIANVTISHGIAVSSLKKALNSVLPDDIVVHGLRSVSKTFNARFGARSKIYRYCVSSGDVGCAIGRQYAYHFSYPLDTGLMRKGAGYLIGRHDFTSFASSGSEVKDPRCKIIRIDIKKRPNIITFDIEADYFLYKMVRNIVGTLLEVGRGKIKPSSVKSILGAKDRRKAGPNIPARGLCLMSVKY
ncbi:MAG: tRNA pseudouridine(38-40) synthase TruA [bacterium]